MSDLLDRRTYICTDRQTNITSEAAAAVSPPSTWWQMAWRLDVFSLTLLAVAATSSRSSAGVGVGGACEWGREVNRGQRPWNVAQSNFCIVRTSAKLPTGVSVQQQNGVPVAEGRQDQTQEILVGDAEVGTLEERNHNHMGTTIFYYYYYFLTV